jgi:hypothetical protein
VRLDPPRPRIAVLRLGAIPTRAAELVVPADHCRGRHTEPPPLPGNSFPHQPQRALATASPSTTACPSMPASIQPASRIRSAPPVDTPRPTPAETALIWADEFTVSAYYSAVWRFVAAMPAVARTWKTEKTTKSRDRLRLLLFSSFLDIRCHERHDRYAPPKTSSPLISEYRFAASEAMIRNIRVGQKWYICRCLLTSWCCRVVSIKAASPNSRAVAMFAPELSHEIAMEPLPVCMVSEL